MIVVSNNIKPITSVLNCSHPSANGLKGDWDFSYPGLATDLSGNGIDLSLNTSSNNYITGDVGPAYHAVGGTVTNYDSLFTYDELTFMIGFSYRVDGTFKNLIESNGSGAYTPVTFRVSNATSTIQLLQRDATGSNRSVIATGLSYDTYYVAFVRFAQYPGQMDMWIDGQMAYANGAPVFTPQNSTNTTMGLNANRYIDVSVMGIWDRVLAESEISELSADPFSLIRRPMPLCYFDVPAVPVSEIESAFWERTTIHTVGGTRGAVHPVGNGHGAIHPIGGEKGKVI
ncbi:MAG: hypothetical protein CL946_06320 [Ectothiorhodospiraceae bacterium]|nr:hypothetical protein [Ectothiorhodospiraceae bacterium]